MIAGIQLKVCGQTRAADAQAAEGIGADYLGFILYPKSPRYLSLERYQALVPELPAGPRRVAVMVEPSRDELAAAEAFFDLFQIHFPHTTPVATLQTWSRVVGADRLWLAPKLPPEAEVSAEWLPLARSFLLDTFHAEGFGGSGKTGDWAKFARHRDAHPRHTWILAGGLGPANIVEAVTGSGASVVDVNSGVESSPGIKDSAKLAELAERLAAVRR